VRGPIACITDKPAQLSASYRRLHPRSTRFRCITVGAQCPVKNLPEKEASRWGESLTADKMSQCRWVRPKLICQVAFVEWTDAGHLRHCTFIGMRDDKKAAEVVRET
jgi:ATP-dependent DNA ligase